MISRDTKYEMPEIFREQDPNQAVARKQLERLAGLVPLEFGADIFDWLARPDAPTGVSFPDQDPLQSSITYQTIINNNTGGGGTGAAGAKTVTFIVGPSANADSDTYDYVTDGTNDQVQIQAAIDDLPAGGGKIVFREGTYNIAPDSVDDYISILGGNNITLEGMGASTIFKFNSGLDDSYVMVSLGNHCRVQNIKFDGNATNRDLGASYSGNILDIGYNSVVIGCHFTDAWGNALACFGYNVSIIGCIFVNNFSFASAGIDAVVLCTNLCNVVGCYFYQSATYSDGNTLYLLFDGGGYNTFSDNVFELGGTFIGTAITLDYASTANGNTIFSGGHDGSVFLYAGTQSSVTGNTIEGGGTSALDNTIGIGLGYLSTAVGNMVSFINGVGIYSSSGYNSINANILSEISTDGIVCSATNDSVVGNVLTEVGGYADNTYSGIYIDGGGGTTRNVVSSNRIRGDHIANHLKYCIREDTGGDYNLIIGNIATGADTSQISTVGANTVTANNITT